MSAIASNLDPATLARLDGLELRARHIADGYLSGKHRGTHHGQSVEFTEHREYTPGDDLRYVDWKVFGKTDKVYLKQFEAETDLVCYVLLDISESMLYRSEAAPLSKLQYAQCVAAALAEIVLRQRDNVGLATYDNQIRALVREGSNPSHRNELIGAMQQAEARQKSAFGAALREFSQRIQRRGIVVLLSDLLGDTEELLAGLKRLRYARHEIMVLQLLDPTELEFQFDQITSFRGLEASPTVLVEPRGVRQAYLSELQAFLQRIKIGCRALQVDYSLVNTRQPFDEALRHILMRRRVR